MTGAFDYLVTIDENSYAVNTFDEGMSVTFTGPAICEQLTSSEVRISEGTTTVTLTPSEQGEFS